MESSLQFYGKFLALLVTVSLMVCFNFVTWGFHRSDRPRVWHLPGAHPERAPALIRKYGCAACHTLPGTVPAPRAVGPSLEKMESQLYVAGTLANSPENLMRWIQDPQAIHPNTAMPDLNIDTDDARDIAAYLYNPQAIHSQP